MLLLAIVVFLAGALFLQGLIKIEESPPHIAIVTFFGKRLERQKEEGWRFFFLRGLVYGFVLINIQVRNFDPKPQTVRAANNDECEVPVHFTYEPVAEYTIPFDNRGQNSGVEAILTDITKDKLRQYCRSKIEGPANGEEILSLGDDAVGVLLKEILGQVLNEIPSAVPTPILRKYFSGPQRPLGEVEAKEWGKNFERVEKILAQEYPNEKDDGWPTVKTAIDERNNIIKAVKSGNGKCVHKTLGIRILRLNIGEIKPLGEFKQGIERQIKEERDRVAEKTQRAHFVKETKIIQDDLSLGSSEQAAEYFMLQQEGKLTKHIEEKKLNVTPETRGFSSELITNTAKIIADAIAQKGGAK